MFICTNYIMQKADKYNQAVVSVWGEIVHKIFFVSVQKTLSSVLMILNKHIKSGILHKPQSISIYNRSVLM